MTPLREFDHYRHRGTVTRRTPDDHRAASLREGAKRRYRFLRDLRQTQRLTDQSADFFIEQCYDVLMELIRARLFGNGYHSTGQGAHEAEVSYLRELGTDEKDVRFMDQLRYFRNGIKYYGRQCDTDYAKRVLAFTDKLYPKLKSPS